MSAPSRFIRRVTAEVPDRCMPATRMHFASAAEAGVRCLRCRGFVLFRCLDVGAFSVAILFLDRLYLCAECGDASAVFDLPRWRVSLPALPLSPPGPFERRRFTILVADMVRVSNSFGYANSRTGPEKNGCMWRALVNPIASVQLPIML